MGNVIQIALKLLFFPQKYRLAARVHLIHPRKLSSFISTQTPKCETLSNFSFGFKPSLLSKTPACDQLRLLSIIKLHDVICTCFATFQCQQNSIIPEQFLFKGTANSNKGTKCEQIEISYHPMEETEFGFE